MRYLLDSNVFIQAKNTYYAPDICPGFWEWLDHAHATGEIASIVSVYDELAKGNDDLAVWIKSRRNTGWFLDVSDLTTQGHYQSIVATIASQSYKQAAQADFLGGADPWLIAKTMDTGAVIVTLEKFNPNRTNKITIPDVCHGFNIRCLDTFILLRSLAASFVLANT